MLTMVLADAELELIPLPLRDHPAARAYGRRRGRPVSSLILDSSVLHSALSERRLPGWERRGRPDIIHHFLINCMDSPLNIEGGLRVLIHTRNNDAITIRPDTSLPRNYNRFLGLFEQLLAGGGAVPSGGEPLLRLERGRDLASVVAEAGGDRVIVLAENGSYRPPRVLLQGLKNEGVRNLTAVVGGFPGGGFLSPMKPEWMRVSVFEKPLTAWAAAAELLAGYRITFSASDDE